MKNLLRLLLGCRCAADTSFPPSTSTLCSALCALMKIPFRSGEKRKKMFFCALTRAKALQFDFAQLSSRRLLPIAALSSRFVTKISLGINHFEQH
jgi:hypothetical protein